MLTELEAERDEKMAEYRAAKVAPTHGGSEVNFDHDGHRKALLAEIKELRLLIIQERGGVVRRTQLFG
jgi:hypothetical protein